MQAVARLLGVSRATVHRWFGTRDALMLALFEHMAAEFREGAEAEARGRATIARSTSCGASPTGRRSTRP